VGAIVGTGVGVGASVGTGVGVGASVATGVGLGAPVGSGVALAAGSVLGDGLGPGDALEDGDALGEGDTGGVAPTAGAMDDAKTAAEVAPFPAIVTCMPATGEPEIAVFETMPTSTGAPDAGVICMPYAVCCFIVPEIVMAGGAAGKSAIKVAVTPLLTEPGPLTSR
jgi:hypothetical protein